MADISVSGYLPGGETYAGFWRRFLAAVIDLAVISVIDILIIIYSGIGGGKQLTALVPGRTGFETGNTVGPAMGSPSLILSVILVTLVLIPWLYYAILESSNNKATLGKMAARVIVTDLHGNQLTFARATLRHFSKYLSFLLLMSGFVCIAYTRYHQGLHDIIGACLVWYQKQIIG